MERVCTTGDPDAVNVIWIKIIEGPLPTPEKLMLLWPILGENTQATVRDAAARWGYAPDFLRSDRGTIR
jgi:hypothetical protein